MHKFWDTHWIQTRHGAIRLDSPDPEDIHIEDIAHALSNICRFGGHSPIFYSVAQHSILVSTLVPNDPILQLTALLHDAAEAYTGDITTPVKKLLGSSYYNLEWNFNCLIGEKFGIGQHLSTLPPDVKFADSLALKAEVRDIVGTERYAWNWPNQELDISQIPIIKPVSAEESYDLFMQTYHKYRSLQ